MAAHQDQELMRDPKFGPNMQHFWVTPIYVLVRFGKWEEILNKPEPSNDFLYPTGIWHYTRDKRSSYLVEKDNVADLEQ